MQMLLRSSLLGMLAIEYPPSPRQGVLSEQRTLTVRLHEIERKWRQYVITRYQKCRHLLTVNLENNVQLSIKSSSKRKDLKKKEYKKDRSYY